MDVSSEPAGAAAAVGGARRASRARSRSSWLLSADEADGMLGRAPSIGAAPLPSLEEGACATTSTDAVAAAAATAAGAAQRVGESEAVRGPKARLPSTPIARRTRASSTSRIPKPSPAKRATKPEAPAPTSAARKRPFGESENVGNARPSVGSNASALAQRVRHEDLPRPQARGRAAEDLWRWPLEALKGGRESAGLYWVCVRHHPGCARVHLRVCALGGVTDVWHSLGANRHTVCERGPRAGTRVHQWVQACWLPHRRVHREQMKYSAG
eukprot:4462000-Prymnesium_polylepis.2